MKRLYIIADDVTGACDTGAKFLDKGRKVDVYIDSASFEKENCTAEIISVSTNSRAKTPEKAKEIVRQLADRLGTDGVWFKKIDSMLRGNIGSELEALLEARGYRAAVVCSVLPEQNRTMVDGVLQARLADGGIHTVGAAEQISETSHLPVVSIPLDVIRQGETVVRKEIRTHCTNGNVILLPDAESEEDLCVIAKAVAKAEGILLAGSAGIAKHLSYGCEKESSSGVIVAAIGSISPATIRQLEKLKNEPEISFSLIQTSALLNGNQREREIDRIANELCDAKKPVLLVTTEDAYAGSYIEISKNISNLEITDAFAEIAKRVLQRRTVNGMLLSGGDTAESFFKKIGVQKLRLNREVLPGLVMMTFEAGETGPVPVVTKSGSFGDENAISDIIRFLQTYECN